MRSLGGSQTEGWHKISVKGKAVELTGLQVNTKRNRKTTEKKSIVTQVQIPLARQEVPGSVGRRPGSCAWVGGTEKRKKKDVVVGTTKAGRLQPYFKQTSGPDGVGLFQRIA